MTIKFNRDITFTLREINEGVIGEPVSFFGSIVGREDELELPYSITANIEKSITSNVDQCRVVIENFEALEKIYQQPTFFTDEFLNKNLILTVFLGYDDLIQVFSGDLLDITVSGGTNINDQSITLTAASGHKAISKGKLKMKFSAGQTQIDVVNECFKIYESFGIKLEPELLVDPDNKLIREPFKKPRTEDRLVSNILNDICREWDMTWGIGERQDQASPQRAYFVDKRATFDQLGLFGDGRFSASSQTGLIGLPSLSGTKFTFTHRFDKVLNIGRWIALDFTPQIENALPWEGRINEVNISASNKGGSFDCRCTASFLEPTTNDGRPVALAILNKDRVNVGAEALS